VNRAVTKHWINHSGLPWSFDDQEIVQLPCHTVVTLDTCHAGFAVANLSDGKSPFSREYLLECDYMEQSLGSLIMPSSTKDMKDVLAQHAAMNYSTSFAQIHHTLCQSIVERFTSRNSVAGDFHTPHMGLAEGLPGVMSTLQSGINVQVSAFPSSPPIEKEPYMLTPLHIFAGGPIHPMTNAVWCRPRDICISNREDEVDIGPRTNTGSVKARTNYENPKPKNGKLRRGKKQKSVEKAERLHAYVDGKEKLNNNGSDDDNKNEKHMPSSATPAGDAVNNKSPSKTTDSDQASLSIQPLLSSLSKMRNEEMKANKKPKEGKQEKPSHK